MISLVCLFVDLSTEETIILALSSDFMRFDSACFPDLNINSYNGCVLIEAKGERECDLQILAFNSLESYCQ